MASYDYTDADGRVLFQVVRLEPNQKEPKPFRQRRPDGRGGWVWDLNGIEPTLYRLPRVLSAIEAGRTVYIVEGERDVHTLEDLGFMATTNPMGAGKWRDRYSEVLRGARVVILPDNDAPGRDHAERVARSLCGVAASVRVLALPGLAHKQDASDWVAAGGTREKLERLAEEAPEWQASAGALGTAAVEELTPTSSADLWEPPIPFHQIDLPRFPTDALPGWLRAFVEAEAEATQTPADLAAMLALSSCALALAKRTVVRVGPGWTEPLNIWTMTEQPPGCRKTQVFSDSTAPVEAFEQHEMERRAPEIAEATARYEIARKRSERAREQAAKSEDGVDRAALEEEAVRLARDLAAMRVPVPPRLMADDTSPERLATLLFEQGGRMALMSPEGGVFELMAGRYSANGAPNLEVYLKSHAGDTLRVDRVGRPAEYVREPALTLGLTVQPDVIRALADKPGFRGRGLLGRFLYALPPNLLGRRRIGAPPVPPEVRETYHRNLRSLLELPGALDEEGQPAAHVLALSPEATRRLTEFAAWIEPQLGEWGELATMTDWAGKLVGTVARLAGILHVAERAGPVAPWEEPIPPATVERAIRIGRYAIPHARAAYAEMGADPVVEEARHVLAWITRSGVTPFTKRDCFNGVRGRFHRVEAMEPALRLLVEHGYVREREPEDRRGAGRPSTVYDVNPYTQNSQNTQNPESERVFADIADFAYTLPTDSDDGDEEAPERLRWIAAEDQPPEEEWLPEEVHP